jgi:hypothetical protein
MRRTKGLAGGGGSPEQTALQLNFPLTGKDTGIFQLFLPSDTLDIRSIGLNKEDLLPLHFADVQIKAGNYFAIIRELNLVI